MERKLKEGHIQKKDKTETFVERLRACETVHRMFQWNSQRQKGKQDGWQEVIELRWLKLVRTWETYSLSSGKGSLLMHNFEVQNIREKKEGLQCFQRRRRRHRTVRQAVLKVLLFPVGFQSQHFNIEQLSEAVSCCLHKPEPSFWVKGGGGNV